MTVSLLFFVFSLLSRNFSQDLLYPVNPATNVTDTSGGPATGDWLLRSSVDVENGVMLEVMSTATAGGDANRVHTIFLICLSTSCYFPSSSTVVSS